MADKSTFLIGIDDRNRPIVAPKNCHSLVMSAAGGHKTTGGSMTRLMSFLGDTGRAVLVNDVKSAELFIQSVEMCRKHGRKVALIDGARVLPIDQPERVEVNPLGAVIASFQENAGDLVFSMDTMTHALIEEPKEGDARNYVFRDRPRAIIEYVVHSLLNRNPALATPGAVWALISDPKLLLKAAALDAEESDE